MDDMHHGRCGATKRKHYVPRFYLRRFVAKDGNLSVYRHETGKWFRTVPENVCTEGYLYEAKIGTGASGDKFFLENDIEGRLSAKERELSESLDKLLACCDERDFESADFEEGRTSACALAANLIARSPAILGSDRAHAGEVAREFERDEGLTDADWELLGMLGLEGSLEPVADVAIMRFLLSDDGRTPASKVRGALEGKTLMIAEAPRSMPFVSCSSPVYFLDVNEAETDARWAYLALSSRYAAIFVDDGRVGPFLELPIEGVVRLNSLLLADGDMWDTAFACARGPIEAAVNRCRELGRL